MTNLIIDILYALMFAIFARVIVSWFVPQSGGVNNPIVRIIFQITEPILGPIRKVLPRTGMFDFAPMIAMITLGVIISILKDA